MAMTSGGVAQHHVTPSLYLRTAPLFLPATSVAVRKAVRDFDEYVYEAAALCAHLGYELPKKAVKAGVTIVEIIMSEKQVALFFPDPTYRMFQRGKASMYDRIRPTLVFMFALFCARMYFAAYYVPTVTWWDLMWYYFPFVWDWLSVLFSFVGAVTVVLSIMIYHIWWSLIKTFYDVSLFVSNVNVAVGVVGGTVRHFHWLPSAVHEFLTIWFRFTRESVCAQYHHSWFCPALKPTCVQRVTALVAHTYWAVVPLLRYAVFWQALGVFFVVRFLVDWLTRRRTVWKVQLRIESQAFSIARGQKTRAKQETTSEKVAATPIITHVENHVKTAHANMPVELRDKYLAICLLISSGWADNRVQVVQTTPGEPDAEPVQDNKRESLGDLGVEKRLLRTRNNTCPPNVWRRSIRVIKKSWNKLFDDVQRGQDRVLPGQDEIKEHYSGVVTGPEFFDITEGFEGNMDDEIAGVSRHLRQLKSTLTGEYIPREISTEAELRLDIATGIICFIVGALANKHFLSVLEWTLPQKWGNARSVYYQRLVEIAHTVVQPFLTGFVKTCELALPINKLPRLVGSMGMLCCAKDAAVLGSVEQLFKKFLPHLVVKGMTQDGVCARFAAFARRAKRLGLKLLSIDMSAMDSSWTENDRKRVRRVMAIIIDTLQELLDAELQADYVSQCAAKQRSLRWMLKYIEVQLSAADSILFSGERGTSIGNRILMLIVWGAELLRVYGLEEGADRIHKMFQCPAEAHYLCTDERAHGQTEQAPVVDKFPEDLRYDNNIGDGDDCALAIPHDMYATKEDFVRSYEAYYKLVEPCCSWDEGTDIECLSMMCITAGDKQFFVPKVARNAQRLIAHKIRVTPGRHFAEGRQTYTPNVKEYAEIATDLWQRSFALKHSMVSRHLNRAMFEYCHAKAGDRCTVYDDDMHRLGKIDGDLRLSECLEQVRQNATCDVSAWVMVKATHFATMASLSDPQIRVLKNDWYASDYSWSTLELTDDLCAHPDVLLSIFPIGANVATGLGFRRELVDQLKRQLVKGEGVSPDMSVGTRPGGHEESVSDGASQAIVQAASVIVYQGAAVLSGYEPYGKPRAGMLTVPAGKLEKGESFEEAAVRELEEEGALYVRPSDLVFVREHTCGKMQCKQYCVDYSKSQPSSMLTADRLTDLKFRTAAVIQDEHAPKLIANCIKEVIHEGIFIPSVFGVIAPLQATTTFPENSPGHVTMHGSKGAPGSSALVHPAFEVKPATAEVDGMGPSQPDDYTHSHVCPMCGVEYSHSHKHDKRFEHKPRVGACPNEHCSHHKSECKKAADALTSSEQREIRQPSVSSPVNGNGTPHQGKSAGKGKAGKTSGKGLSHPTAVSQNAGSSHARAAESKGKSVGEQSKGKFPKVWMPITGPQTAAGDMTPVPKMWKILSPTVPPIVDEVSRVSEGQHSVCGGVMSGCADTCGETFAEVTAERAGTSGHQHPDGGDIGIQPPGPGAACQ